MSKATDADTFGNLLWERVDPRYVLSTLYSSTPSNSIAKRLCATVLPVWLCKPSAFSQLCSGHYRRHPARPAVAGELVKLLDEGMREWRTERQFRSRHVAKAKEFPAEVEFLMNIVMDVPDIITAVSRDLKHETANVVLDEKKNYTRECIAVCGIMHHLYELSSNSNDYKPASRSQALQCFSRIDYMTRYGDVPERLGNRHDENSVRNRRRVGFNGDLHTIGTNVGKLNQTAALLYSAQSTKVSGRRTLYDAMSWEPRKLASVPAPVFRKWLKRAAYFHHHVLAQNRRSNPFTKHDWLFEGIPQEPFSTALKPWDRAFVEAKLRKTARS